MSGRGLERPAHDCLEATAGRALAGARLTDQQRVAVALQGAALLSLLEQSGWRLTSGWESARVDRNGLLGSIAAQRGAQLRGGRELLTRLIRTLFGEPDEVAGRGQARRAARHLTALWRRSSSAISPDRLVGQILDSAPFLWRPRFAGARRRLVGELTGRDRPGLWIAGPERFRHLLPAAGGRQAVETLLAGPDAGRIWLAAAREAKRCKQPGAGVESGPGERRLRAALRAAEAAWQRRDRGGLERHLQRARPALEASHLAWRWHRLQARRAEAVGDGELVVRNLERALWLSRRELGGRASAELWRGLATGRALLGDLAGAERALLHAVRLGAGGLAAAGRSSVLGALASIRLRRGRVAEAEDALERWSRAGPAVGPPERQLEAELGARLELARGRPAAALDRLDGAVSASGDARPGDWRRRVPDLLAARALCWLDRGEEASRLLELCPARAWLEIEAEERPALWLAVGHRRRAGESSSGPFAPLWRRLLAGEPPADSWWQGLSAIEPFRAARLVLDVERLLPGSSPRAWRRRVAKLPDHSPAPGRGGGGAAPRGRAWSALAAYLHGEGEPAAALARLFAEAGYPTVRLTWVGEHGELVLVAGEGGSESLEEPCGRGRVVLAASGVDTALRALFAVAVRDITPPADLASGVDGTDGMVGESPPFRRALVRIGRLAPREIPVLIVGETGTGKELAARRVHRLSPRAERPLLAVNCAALSDSLLLSELFGHVRGAFTGAERDRAGIFEAAQSGTVFLDEVGDLPSAAQGKLLRVLQEGEVRRLGESAPRPVDVRIVAATHRDLASMVAQGGFRRDLYYRLRVACVELPTLRDRGEDVNRLAGHFLSGETSCLSGAARRRLLAYAWPGNVRELQNVLRVAVALADGGTILPHHLEIPSDVVPAALGYHRQIEDLRRRLVREALAATQGNRAAAAGRLGLSRQALAYLARRFEIA